jgi:hypothetical protein
MARMSHSVEIAVPVERAFDFVTTAANWPRYHTASAGVEGEGVGRAAERGDVIVEHARTAAGYRGRLIWHVVEVARPTLWVIDGFFPVGRIWRRHAGTIAYDFRPRGDSVEVTREMDYSAGLLAPLARLVHGREERECAAAMESLKEVLEHERRPSYVQA